jgi:tRNA nucleotidyltransferase (CCA-adding enzyme)
LNGLAKISEAATRSKVYLVGGAVRDLLLGRARTDLDVAVEGEMREMRGIARRLGGETLVHERFATASVRVEGLEVDLATARAETYPRPGALPDVRPASLADDLARRDFTINAMAIPLQGRVRLVDPHGGRDDLDRGLLRVLHPGSFVDDPTRALRAARYAARFGFGLASETEPPLRAADLGTVSSDRVEAELLRLCAEERAARGFELLGEWGLIELDPTAPELVDRVLKLLAAPPWSEVAERGLAVHAAAIGVAPGPAGRLRDLRGAARELAAARPELPSRAVSLARGRSGVELALARALGAEWLDPYVSDWRHVHLEISGSDLIAAGVPQGPAVGRGLEEALRQRLDGEIAGREAELEAALEAARRP